MFGLSTLTISYNSGVSIPPQNQEIFVNSLPVKGIVKGFFSGLVVGILPGIGASQAGVVVHQLTRGKGLKEFLVALGGINTVAALFSLLSLYLISHPRSGTAIAVEQIVGTLGFSEFLLLVATTMFAGGVAVITTLKLARQFASFIQKVDYRFIKHWKI